MEGKVFFPVLGLLLAALTACTAGDDAVTAWDYLAGPDEHLASEVSAAEREALQLMSPEQGIQYLRGRPSAEIELANGQTLDRYLAQKGLSALTLSWHSIDGGGARLAGGNFRLTATVGQTDSASMAGGVFSLSGGFAPGLDDTATAADAVFCNSFESVPSTGCEGISANSDLQGEEP